MACVIRRARIEGAQSATGKRHVSARLGWAGVKVRPLRARDQQAIRVDGHTCVWQGEEPDG